MNIVFWGIIILLVAAIWLILVTSGFSAEIGDFIKDTKEVIQENFKEDEERKFRKWVKEKLELL